MAVLKTISAKKGLYIPKAKNGLSVDKDPKQLKLDTNYIPTRQDSIDIANNYKDLISAINSRGYDPYVIPEPPERIKKLNARLKKAVIFDINSLFKKDNIDYTKEDNLDFNYYISQFNDNSSRYRDMDIRNEGNLYSAADFIPGIINTDLPRQLFHPKIEPINKQTFILHHDIPSDHFIFPKAKIGQLGRGGEGDKRVVANYQNIVDALSKNSITQIPQKELVIESTFGKQNKTIIPKSQYPIETINKLTPQSYNSNQPKIEQRPYIPVNTKREDRIFFQYSPGGKNNYINWGEGKGNEPLTNQQADELYQGWQQDGTMQILGETEQSNYKGKYIPKLKQGGRIDDPPGGFMSKEEAYWWAVHGSKENNFKDANIGKDVYKRIYVPPDPIEFPIYSENIRQLPTGLPMIAEGQDRVWFVKNTPSAKKWNSKQIGSWFTKRGLQSLGRSASRFMNVLVPGAEDMPVILLANPDYLQREQMQPKKLKRGAYISKKH